MPSLAIHLSLQKGIESYKILKSKLMAPEVMQQLHGYDFNKSYCPYCVDVKKLLSQLGASFKAIELDQESDGSQLQSALHEWTGQRTVPNVFIGGNHIGGCDSTTALHKEGKLVPLLTQVGALAEASKSSV